MEGAGHESYFLTCDGLYENCYSRSLKGTSKLKECSQCMLGGVRTYKSINIDKVRNAICIYPHEFLDDISFSSSCTLHRIEVNSEWNNAEVVKTRSLLRHGVASTYESVRNWIENRSLDAVIVFNGRIDMTNAVITACSDKKIPFITHERTWFGDGLLLNPGFNCLSLKANNYIVGSFKDKFLTFNQSKKAAKLLAERFLQKNTLEWRVYNKKPKETEWPIAYPGKRVLVLPSSRNEFSEHPDWKSEWEDNTIALENLLEVFNISPQQVVVRCHPNWSENIGKVSGDKSKLHYQNWARKRGIYLIESDDTRSTYDLIQQADIVVLNGSSSAVEAGACGKQIICLGSSTYENAGFVTTFKSINDMNACGELIDIDPVDVIRKTLRFVYSSSNRLPQFVNYVRALKTTKYKYFEGADPTIIERMISTGEVLADDDGFEISSHYEDLVISKILSKDWESLIKYSENFSLEEKNIKRRFAFRWVDGLRGIFKRGDL